MALPKRKHSHSRTRKRRTGKGLKNISLVICPQCRNYKPPHKACPFCGYYKGREIVDTVRKQAKKEKKGK